MCRVPDHRIPLVEKQHGASINKWTNILRSCAIRSFATLPKIVNGRKSGLVWLFETRIQKNKKIHLDKTKALHYKQYSGAMNLHKKRTNF